MGETYVAVKMVARAGVVEDLFAVPLDVARVEAGRVWFPPGEFELVCQVLRLMTRIAAARGTIMYLSLVGDRVLGEARFTENACTLYLDEDLYLDLASFFILLKVRLPEREYADVIGEAIANTARKMLYGTEARIEEAAANAG